MTEETTPMTFADLGLPGYQLMVLDELGFKTPTPIQVSAIPPLLAGRDVVGIAQTGTGKTAAFGLPLLGRVNGNHRGVTALVLALQLTLLSWTKLTRCFAWGSPKTLRRFSRPFLMSV